MTRDEDQSEARDVERRRHRRTARGRTISASVAENGRWRPKAARSGLVARMSLTRVFTGLAPVVLLASMATPVGAFAAPPPSSDGTPGDAKPVDRDDEARTSDGTADGRRRVTLDDEFLVEGKLEKPNAFYVLRRSTLGYDWARLDARFSPLVLESVQDPLF